MTQNPRERCHSIFLITVGLGFTPHAEGVPEVVPVAIPRYEQKIAVVQEAGNKTSPAYPLRILGENEFFPKAHVYFGAITGTSDVDGTVLGMKFMGTLH